MAVDLQLAEGMNFSPAADLNWADMPADGYGEICGCWSESIWQEKIKFEQERARVELMAMGKVVGK